MEISRFEKAAIKRTAQNTKALRTKRDKLKEKAEALIGEIELLQNQIEAFDAPWKQKYNMSVEEIIASWDAPQEENVESDGSLVGYKSASVGKLLDKMYNPLESVSVTLFAQPKYDEKGIPTYGFYTHKMRVGGVELPCKTPEGMFEEDFISNDLQYVVDKMNEYYG